MHELTRAAVRLYRRSRFKPLTGLLLKTYNFYRRARPKGVVVATIDGIKYELDLNEDLDSTLYYEGCFEPYVTEAIDRLCREGMVVFDVGANMGCHTLRLARRVGPHGRVIAFEPMSQAFSKLTRNVELNGFRNITLERVALSNETKKGQETAFAFSWPLSRVDGSEMLPVHHGYGSKEVVDFVTLDDYMHRAGISRVDFVKVDVDGYEWKVVQGAIKTLRTHLPVMIVELGVRSLREVGDSLTDLVRLLSGVGYQFFSERGLTRFPSVDAVLASIGNRASIKVVLSVTDL